MNINIRPATPADFEAIANVYNEAIFKGGITMDTEPKQATDIQKVVQTMGDREIWLVAALGDPLEGSLEKPSKNCIAGWGVVKKYSDRPGYHFCCETSVYLTFSKVGKGYGKALQAALMEQAAAYSYRHVVAKILANNQSSIRFHKQFGFTPVGIQKEIGFIQDQWHDVMIMQCLIPSS